MASKHRSAESGNDTLVAWKVDEYPRHNRGMRWNIVAVILGLGMLIYSFITLNFLFALIILVFGFIMTVSASRPPGRIAVVISPDGIRLGERVITFRDIDRFWIVYEPGTAKSLYLDFKGFVNPHLGIPLEDTDPNEVRSALKPYCTEDLTREDEPLSDYLGRVLKL